MSLAKKILVVEDEKNILELVRFHLEAEGYSVVSAVSGNKGFELVRQERPDLAILDWMLPGLSGMDLCRQMRADTRTRNIPIIILTAKSQEADRVLGLELGADDYLTKPFSPRELVARVRAHLRRSERTDEAVDLRVGGITLDTERHRASVNEHPIELTAKEFALLKALMESKGRVLNRDFLLERVWGYDQSAEIETRTVDMHIGQLRKKLGSEAERIVTIKNVGYRLDDE